MKDGVEEAVKKITDRFGEYSLIKLGDDPHANVEMVSTGSLALDRALGGGVPKGRIIEIYGPESSGKTTVCQHIIAEAQKNGGACAFIDMEHALDPDYAETTGVNVGELFFSQPDDGETALELVEAIVRSGKFDVVVIDSVAALVPRKELEGEMADNVVGMQARLMSKAMRKLSGAVKQTKTIVVFTNQLRQKIGVMFGNPETTPGGMALKFYASQRLDIRRAKTLKNGDTAIGAHTRVRVVKNKVAAPFKIAEFDIVFDEGISASSEILDLGVETKVLTKKGAWYYYGEEKLGQGKENARQTLLANREMFDELKQKVRESLDA